MSNTIHILGVRHHGPGSARSVRRVLEALKPDCVLVEGPPDAAEVLPLLAHPEMKPPVALLIYGAEDAKRAVYYPFAVFSPEYQAVEWALRAKAAVRFMDLPQAHRFALDERRTEKLKAEREAREKEQNAEGADGEGSANAAPPPAGARPPPAPGGNPAGETEPEPELDPRADPLGALARAAGFPDGETWWEHVVEHRGAGDLEIFGAILDAMSALRERSREVKAVSPEVEDDDALREAWMRKVLRAAQKEGHRTIAVVCGAWHAPALVSERMPPAKEDDERLKDLPKSKVLATWVPWSYSRLTWASGYGAGIASPGFYDHLWRHPEHAVLRWMTDVARFLREEDIDCSSAHVIEGVRLADSLAALRGRHRPGMAELSDATRAVFCFDSDLPMRLIGERLVVGRVLGEVPDETPQVPLQRDLAEQQKKLRFKPEAFEKQVELDLRSENDLARSHLLHRLNLIHVPWGELQESGNVKGTFRERWSVRWDPELAVKVIEAGAWGNTVAQAAAAYARDTAAKAADLPELTALLDHVLLADLPEAVDEVMRRLENAAALASDVGQLMDALVPLAGVRRYGNVRRTDTALVEHAIAGLVARVTVGLSPAAASLNDEAAAAMVERLSKTNSAIGLVQKPEHDKAWRDALRRLADLPNVHGLVAGRAVRLLLDAGELSAEAAATRLSLALSRATEPATAAHWIEGFLRGSGQLLLLDRALWNVIDEWVSGIAEETFTQVLPLVRRTFSTFAPAERRQMGQLAAKGRAGTTAKAAGGVAEEGAFDHARAATVLPIVKMILGGGGAAGGA